MKELLYSTGDTWTGLILRITAGMIMLPHGAQKMFGLFGGFGFSATVNFFTETMKLPWLIAVMVIVIEFFGAIGLIIGIGTKIWAAGFIAVMLGAIMTTNYPHGFFMNWFGTQQGEGFEYHLLVIGICLALMISGGGKYSADTLIAY
ncbi:DoxX family protein [bacterium]|nr:DoxX family protein [bacterium]